MHRSRGESGVCSDGETPFGRLRTRVTAAAVWWSLALVAGCGAPEGETDVGNNSASLPEWQQSWPAGSDPFADRVVLFEPGPGASYGHDAMPEVVLGRPQGRGDRAGSLDVVSLGEGGQIMLAFDDLGVVDGPGPDLLIFENAFIGWPETGQVGVSRDGEVWSFWPCDASDAAGGFPGCAGVRPVFANAQNNLDPTDPDEAGGDAFDLALLPSASAAVDPTPWRYVIIVDSGENPYEGVGGGFDLDAIAAVNWEAWP